MNLALRLKRLDRLLQITEKRLTNLQSYRLYWGLSVFGLLVGSQIYKDSYLEWVALVFALPLFLYFFSRSRRVLHFFKELQSLKSFYEHFLNWQNGELKPSFPLHKMSDQNMARDLDLHHFFSQIDFSFSEQGQNLLNRWLCQKEITPAFDRPQVISNLLKSSGPLRRLHMEPENKKLCFERMEKQLARGFLPEKMHWKWIIPLSWFGIILSLVFGAPGLFIKVSLFVYIGSMLFFMGRTQHLFSQLQDVAKDFQKLSRKMKLLEKLARLSEAFPELKKGVASKDLASLNQLISLMSVKANPILFYILNLILPWDFLLAHLSEKRRQNIHQNFSGWSSEIQFLEAASSVVNLKLYCQTQWAQTVGSDQLNVQAMVHPLLDAKKAVPNDFSRDEHGISIITGSNMSGKSTFLRALGLNLCLANMDGPVFAKSFEFKKQKIVSCIRVSDSLRDGQSYFYAEVLRMKFILEAARKEPLLFLIDEPFRGTNNKERLIGNQSYLQQILETGASGFLCTHDLELTKLSDNQKAISNYHFSETWMDQDLRFDYKIKPGPSQSTNALKILEKEGLFKAQDASN